MSILPFADPETLEILDLFPLDNNMEIEIDEIVKTEQWKNANSIHCEFYALNIRVEDITDFSTVFIKTLSISARDLDYLKKAFITSSKFESFELQLRNFNVKQEVPDVRGPAFHTLNWRHWYFRNKDSEENILRIGIYPESRLICFDITELSNVSNEAILQE